MYIYQYVVIFLLLTLCLNSKSRRGAITIITAYFFIFILLSLKIEASIYIYYYSISAFLCLFCALYLQSFNELAAICLHFLVLLNAYGAYQWVNYLPHTSYDFIFAIIMNLLIVTLIPKGLIDGMFNRRLGVKSIRDYQ